MAHTARDITAQPSNLARAAAAGVAVLSSASNDTAKAVELARQADVTIVVTGTTSGEAQDRKDLHLDSNADEMVAAVAGAGSKTVVLVQGPV